MMRNQKRASIAVLAFCILMIALHRSAMAQTQAPPLADTPNQRWLPPPKPYPAQAESQAKLLSRIRDMVLNSDQNTAKNPSRLSVDDVESLKKAMKQFNGELPDGLNMESLDAIPPDLIAKALSDPELVRKAKELAKKFSKKDGARTNRNPEVTGDSPNEPEPKQTPSERNAESSDLPSQPRSQSEPTPSERRSPKPIPPMDKASKVDENQQSFDSLMEKLRSTQQQFEKNQERGSDARPSNNAIPSNRPPAIANSESNQRPESGATKPQSPSANPTPKADKDLSPTKSLPPRSNPFDSNRNQQPSRPSGGITPPTSGPAQGTPDLDSKNTQRTDPTSRQEWSNNASDPPNPSNNASGIESKSSGLSPNSSTDLRKELERRGFGPTLKKIVEDAQRSAAQSKASSNSQTPTIEQQPKASSKPPTLGTPEKSMIDKSASTNPAKPSPPKETKPSPSSTTSQSSSNPPKPDSAFSKGIQQTGKYLNSLWSELSKNSGASNRKTESRPTSTAPSNEQEAFSMSNPFDSTTWTYLILLAIFSVLAFFFFRFQYQSEQKKRASQEVLLLPRIDAIRSRDDLVYAFHALAKQRLSSAQAWWTCGVVTERFEHKMPEHTSPIRALSGLYQQARYLPEDHQMTLAQIEEAKTALKRCKG